MRDDAAFSGEEGAGTEKKRLPRAIKASTRGTANPVSLRLCRLMCGKSATFRDVANKLWGCAPGWRRSLQ